ncbi:MAG: hypothetical protein K5924_02225 [Chloroflexi bacterium]|nr:hypothetical protein [Chloroflexota bacterium]
MTEAACPLCSSHVDEELGRTEVWRDDHWRLSMARRGWTLGFSYLEPIRHIPFLADLDGDESATFGPAIARASRVLREVTGARLVHAYVFGGGVAHLHVHLAPNVPEGVLSTALISGDVEVEQLPSGAGRITSRDHPEIPGERLDAVIDQVREAMARG